jgi:hypothetical protein
MTSIRSNAELTHDADASAVQQLLDGEITGHFGMSPGVVETQSVAERLSAWWRTTRR